MRALLVVVVLACSSNKSAPPEPAPGGSNTSEPRPSAASDVRIDRRVELMSIVCALAGFKEYTLGRVNPYRTDVITAFRGFVQHPAVMMARDLRDKHGIGYDAPMILAVHLDDQLVLRNAAELPLLDARWKGVDAEAYAARLRDFARDANLDAFLAAHRAHYDNIEGAVRTAVNAEKPVEWFDGVFGKLDKVRYTVIPAPMTGRSNFGIRATRSDGTLDMYQLISIDTDSGLPVIDADFKYLLVHEMAHSYVNPHLAEHEAELAPVAQKLFAQVEAQMRSQAYPSWQTFLNESIVRATTIVYLQDKESVAVAMTALDHEIERGFRWTKELAELIRAYRKDHVDYVPRLVALLAELGQR